MPLIDLPLAELRTYQGKNPRPHDFEAFWNRSMTQMRALDSKVELRPSGELQSASAECFDLYFTGIGGSRVFAKFLKPRRIIHRAPAVVMLHGYGSNSSSWYKKLAYVAEGFCVAAMDCRGQGGKSQDLTSTNGSTLHGHLVRGLDDCPEKLLFREIFLDTAQLAGILMQMPEVNPDAVGVTGGSQGGGLSLACAALEPRIRRVAPVFPFLCDYQRVWEMDQARGAYQGLQEYFRRYDPLHDREVEIFTKLGYIDVQHLAPWIRGDVLFLTGLMDPVCPPSSQFAAFNKIAAPKEMLVYPDFGHEDLPGGHDRIFNFMMGLKNE